jgi:K+-sensing histidine kinase KdpD
MMREAQRLLQMGGEKKRNWQDYAIDSILALAGTLLITEIIYALSLTRVSNISILYLLFILPLAMVRGHFAGILGSFLAFLAFDYFFIPPIFTFQVALWEGWVALLIFLVVALLTSQLAATVQKNTYEAYIRDQQIRTLDEMMQISHANESFDDVLEMIVRAITRVFAYWGVQACALLLPDEQGKLVVRADAPIQVEDFTLSDNEADIAAQVMEEGHLIDMHPIPGMEENTFLRILPLVAGGPILGVLCLRLSNPVEWFVKETEIRKERRAEGNPIHFFWMFLDVASTLIERENFRQKGLYNS